MAIIASITQQKYDKITRITASLAQVTYHDEGTETGFKASFSENVTDENGKVILPANKIQRFHHTRRLTECSWLLNIEEPKPILEIYRGTFGTAYGNWGHIKSKDRIIDFESRNNGGVLITTITEQKHKLDIERGNIVLATTPGYGDVFDEFVMSLPPEGFYIAEENGLVSSFPE